MKVIVSRKVSFDSAHFLPNYKGKCANLHGHRWLLEVGVEGWVDPATGFVVDFTLLKEQLNRIVEILDHQSLNTIIENPTAENLIKYILGEFEVPEGTKLSFIKLWETPDSCAEYRPNED